MLRAYFDESGTHHGSPAVSIAGFVGKCGDWEALEEQWLAILAPYREKGVRFFHASECIAQRGQYSAIDKPNVNYILTQLAEKLGAGGFAAISSGVSQDAWDAVATESSFLHRFPKPFDLCFDAVLRSLHRWSIENAGGEKVAPMFALQEEYGSRMKDVGDAYGRDRWYRSVLAPISFGHMDEVVPLQAADYLAHQMNWDLIRRIDQSGDPWGGPTVALHKMAPISFGQWFDESGLQLTIDRFKRTGQILV